ncbi:MAG: hypothetical protein WCE94_03190 [Candidatus Methanoperedens sp.]
MKTIIKQEEDPKPYPMPGDLAKISNSHDCLINNRSYGVIEGIIGSKKDEYLVCFNAYSTYRDDTVSASGGPAYMINASDLMESAESVEWTFWKWKDRPRADGGVPYRTNCRVWLYDARKKNGAQ